MQLHVDRHKGTLGHEWYKYAPMLTAWQVLIEHSSGMARTNSEYMALRFEKKSGSFCLENETGSYLSSIRWYHYLFYGEAD